MAVTACASVPSLPYERGVGVVDVLRNVKCELASAYADNVAMAPMRAVTPAPVYVTNLGGPQPQTRAPSGTTTQKRGTARPATGVPQQTQQDLSNIIRSLKQSQTGRD